MAKKDIDITKSATVNAGFINDNFNELYEKTAHAASGGYGSDIVGESVNLLSRPSHLVTDMNTVRMIKDMKDNRVNASIDYGHDSNMVIHDGKAYIVCAYHESGSEEGWKVVNTTTSGGVTTRTLVSKTLRQKVLLTIIDIETMQIVDDGSIILVDIGDTATIPGESSARAFLAPGADNIALLKDENDNFFIRVVFNGSLWRGYNSDETFGENHVSYNEWYNAENGSSDPMSVSVLAYRDYNISDGSIGNIGICTIKKDGDGEIGTEKPLTLANFGRIYSDPGAITCEGQYAFVKDSYYIALCPGGGGDGSGHIFKTTDFINFEWFAAVKKQVKNGNLVSYVDNVNLEYEISVFPWADGAGYACLYIAIRRDRNLSPLTCIVERMYTGWGYWNSAWSSTSGDHAAGVVDLYTEIKCDSSKMHFFAPVSGTGLQQGCDFLQTRNLSAIYLMLSSAAQSYSYREYNDIVSFAKNTFTETTVRRISQCGTAIYPCIRYVGGWYYICYKAGGRNRANNGNQSHIWFSKFRPFPATFDKVVSALNKMFDTFAPE